MNAIIMCILTTIVVNAAQKKPSFTKEPSDHTVTEGEAVKFRAELTGQPKPIISWYLNGKELTDSKTVKITTVDKNGGGVKSSVEFLNPTVANSGSVTVKATNSGGKAQATAQLVVEKK